jgi:hypothetical protein
MKKNMRWLFTMILTGCLTITAYAQAPIRVGMMESYKDDVLKLSSGKREGYHQIMHFSKCPPLDSPLLKDIQRNTLELMIVCHALRNSNLGNAFILIPSPNVKRTLLKLEQDGIDIDGNSKFRRALINRNLLVSDDLLRVGEFELGLFSTRDRKEVLNLKTMAALRKHIGVTVEHWKMDRAVMEQLNLKKVRFVGKGPHLYRAIHSKRADFTFSVLKEKKVRNGEGELIRIEGFKASLPNARVLAISPNRKDIHVAIQRFISKNREPIDYIKNAYIHAGVIPAEYQHWIDVRTAK